MNIVIIDDDTALLRSLEIILTGQGHEVHSFCCPTDAYIYLDNDQQMDVLLLDFIMPGFTGTEVLTRIKGNLPENCRVILISGHTDQLGPAEIESMGVAAYLSKPLDYDELSRLLEIERTIEPQAQGKGSLGNESGPGKG